MKTPFPRAPWLALFAAFAVSFGSFSSMNAVAATAPKASPFSLASEAAVGASLPDAYTCDGAGMAPALAWSNPPAGTKEFAVMMSTVPPDGATKYNWVLYGIPVATNHLTKNSQGVGTLGVGSNGPSVAYQPPCSKGPGPKTYTFTLYALSSTPVLPNSTAVSGAQLLSAMSSLTLGTATLSLEHTRSGTSERAQTPHPPPIATTTTTATKRAISAVQSEACVQVTNSLKASTTGVAAVECDGTYAYVASNGLPTHTMMDGIVASNLQVPVAQSFFGANE